MLKQQVSRIKTVLNILLAVLFVVSLAAAASSVNSYTNISESNGLHNTDLSFDYYGSHIVYKYIGDYDKNYIEHVEYTNASAYDENLNRTVKVDLVEDIKVVNGVGKDNITINGHLVDPQNTLAEVRNEAYSAVAHHEEQAALAAQHIPHLDNISQHFNDTPEHAGLH
jgi:hypothetical protein